MKYEISNIFALSIKDQEYEESCYDNTGVVCERFTGAANELAEGDFLGWQLNCGVRDELCAFAFSKKGAAVTRRDMEWIFEKTSMLCEPEAGSFADVFGEGRTLWLLSNPDAESEDENTPKIRFRKSIMDYFVDVFKELKKLGAAVRIITSAGSGGRGAVVFSFPDSITLRMKTMLSFVIGKMTLTEIDSGANLLHEKNLLSADRFATVTRCFFEAYFKTKEEKTEDCDGELPFDDETIFELDETDPEEAFTPIEELDLSIRSYNSLKRAGVACVEQLWQMSEDELRRIRNLGLKSVNEIREKLRSFRPEPAAASKEPEPSYIEMLNRLIGLENVKEQINKIAALARMKKDIDSLRGGLPIVLNMEFVGNPGTAKTTVARIVAGLLCEIGLIKSGEIVEVGRADLVGKYVGHTADNVKSVFQKAKGKLLFIDEAYSLVEPWEGSFGDEAINTIVQEMENRREDTVVIFAGYPREMEELFSRNPGLRSRVPFTVCFNDYSPEEMAKISELEAEKRGFCITPEAIEKVAAICGECQENTASGNGRFCRNLVEKAILNYAFRKYGTPDSNPERDLKLIADDFTFQKESPAKKERTPIGFIA
ncbi:MAG: AAA family ATPase [Clostridia bacterium]|nr:AAA family ATPase [Clostridia bacterium]